jgi:branched-subunit amino acid ABC-type transport system permease component
LVFVKGGIDPILSLPLLVALLFLAGGVVYRLVVVPVTKAKNIIMASMVATFGVAIVVEKLMSYFWCGRLRAS